MKQKTMIILSVVMSLFLSMTAYAGEKISNVSISVNETKTEPGTVWTAQVESDSSGYEIEDYEWSTDYEFWEPGKKVTLKVTLVTEENTFDRDPYVYGYNCEKASVSRNGSKKLVLKMNYIPRVTLETPSGVHYDSDYVLTWDKVRYAGGYEVELSKDGNYDQTLYLEGRSTTEVDLSEYATDDYLVTAKIKAVAPSGKSNYIESSDWNDFDDDGISVDGDSTTTGKFSGSGQSKQFYGEEDPNVYKTGWQCINGYWYYFDQETGYAVVDSWFNSAGLWYLFDADGKMLTGWRKSGDYWYYLNASVSDGTGTPYGAMKTGWIQTAPASPYYYCNPGTVSTLPYGAMLSDTVTPDGYAVNASGEWYN